MKRFYENVTVSETPDGFRFLLDGKPVQTPARQPLVLPNRVLAEALAFTSSVSPARSCLRSRSIFTAGGVLAITNVFASR